MLMYLIYILLIFAIIKDARPNVPPT